jgi:hypothetical protein
VASPDSALSAFGNAEKRALEGLAAAIRRVADELVSAPDRVAELANLTEQVTTLLGTPWVVIPISQVEGAAEPDEGTGEAAANLVRRLRSELQQARREATEIAAAVESNRDIGAAVGILMCRHHLTQEQAFQTLRQASQHHHIKLRVLARDVIDTGTLDLPVLPQATPTSARPHPAPPLQRPRDHQPP